MAHKPSLNYPPPRRAGVIDNYFGTKVADPYRWMEDLNSPELPATVASWNQLDGWLRRVEARRRAVAKGETRQVRR